jgi:glycosyltransferase involved in cell wall biosynthesis
LFYLFFPAGGIGKYTDQQLEALAQYEDLEIEAVCLPNYHWRDSPSYATWPRLFDISHPFAPVRKIRFLLAQFINPRRLLRRAMSERIDIIHICNINYLSFPTWEKLLDRWGGKLVCTAHDVQRRVAILDSRFEARQLQRFYRRCDAVFVHSRQQQRELQEFADVPAARIHVVPHGPHQYALPDVRAASDLRRRLAIGANRQVALFFGFIRPDKNLDGFINALSQVSEVGVHLVVAGNTSAQGAAYLKQCRALVTQAGLTQHVSFEVRYIPDAEVPDWFALADWVVCAHSAGFSSQSGVLNLAAFYAKPVLATPSGSIHELLSDLDIGVLCDGFGENEIASGIREMAKRLENGKAFDFEGYRQHYSWARNAELIRNVYRKLLCHAP